MTLADCPVHWASKLQSCVSLSTLEAEHVTLSQAMRELVPMRRLLREIVFNVDPDHSEDDTLLKSTIWEDNNGAIATATAPALSPRTKHIATKYHFTRSHINGGGETKETPGISLEKIDTTIQKADILTKGLVEATFEHLRWLLCGW